MPQHLADEQRHLIVYLHQKETSERKIALEVDCTKISSFAERIERGYQLTNKVEL